MLRKNQSEKGPGDHPVNTSNPMASSNTMASSSPSPSPNPSPRPNPSPNPSSSSNPSPSPSSSPRLAGAPKTTVIGENISINGDIKGQEDLIIQGSVKGSVELPAYHLTVGPQGQVEAEIVAANVTISGRLEGNIKCTDKVEITKQANFCGEIKAKRISVEDGAYLKAAIELERDEPPKKSSALASTSSTPKEPLNVAKEAKKAE